jgi:hypothetical protein
MQDSHVKHSLRRFSAAATLVLVSIVCLILPELARAADGSSPRAPQNAFTKLDREDLAERIRERGEVRVIVGLQTLQEIAEGDRAPDAVKEVTVSARQLGCSSAWRGATSGTSSGSAGTLSSR